MKKRMEDAPTLRAIVLDVEIGASPELVWAALTEPERLASWFALEARVTPGAGGSASLSWGEVSWETRIEEWQPCRHLRWVDPLPAGAESHALPVTVDWMIDSRNGRTTLRLVQAGFGADAQWDEHYDATRGGWTWFLLHLKTYLEAHGGKIRRHAAWARQRFEGTASEVWARVLDQLGTTRQLSKLAVGDPVHFVLDSDETLRGVVTTVNMPYQLGVRLDAYGTALLLVELESTRGGPIGLWLSSFGAGAHNEKRLQAAIDRIAGRVVAAD